MAFDPTLATATDRVRLFIGDTGTTPDMPGGETTYASLAALYTSDEAGYAKAAALMLRGYLAQQVTLASSSGDSVQWGNRLKHLDGIIAGTARYPFADGAAAGGLRGLYVGGQSLAPMFRRDSLGTDPTLEAIPGTEDTA